MEMVGMGITQIWILFPKSRSANICSQRSDLGLLGLIWDKSILICKRNGTETEKKRFKRNDKERFRTFHLTLSE